MFNMVYRYDKNRKVVNPVKMPKVKGNDAKRIELEEPPRSFLSKIMKLKINVYY